MITNIIKSHIYHNDNKYNSTKYIIIEVISLIPLFDLHLLININPTMNDTINGTIENITFVNIGLLKNNTLFSHINCVNSYGVFGNDKSS